MFSLFVLIGAISDLVEFNLQKKVNKKMWKYSQPTILKIDGGSLADKETTATIDIVRKQIKVLEIYKRKL